MPLFRFFLFLLTTLCFITTAGVSVAKAETGFTVRNIRFGFYQGQTRVVIDMSHAAPFRVFTLDNPRRVVVDLPSLNWQAPMDHRDNTGIISDYRQGRFKAHTSRLVLDLKKPVRVENVFLLNSENDKPYRLVLDFMPTSQATFLSRLNQTFGVDYDPVLDQAAIKGPKPVKPQLEQPPNAVMTLPQNQGIPDKHVIVLDAGHGGADPGAIAINGMKEKNITLAMARLLKERLESTGRYRVLMTRDRDVFIRLRDRIQFARDHNANLFVSLHADSIRRRNVRGASVYTLSDTASDSETARLAERENRADAIVGIDLSVEEDDVADILIDLAMRDTMNQSKILADNIVAAFQQNRIQTLENPHRSAGFAVLKATDVPAILVEIGFLSSPKEAKLLTQKEHREKIVQALTDGIERYVERAILAEAF